jgi:hypothetical protein
MSHYRPIFFRRKKEMSLFDEGYTYFVYELTTWSIILLQGPAEKPDDF